VALAQFALDKVVELATAKIDLSMEVREYLMAAGKVRAATTPKAASDAARAGVFAVFPVGLGVAMQPSGLV
jgi:hypothetical protein